MAEFLFELLIGLLNGFPGLADDLCVGDQVQFGKRNSFRCNPAPLDFTP
ncbi:MAG: hypothetical protein M3N05_04810 [Pseudomonadota bacterium]|nr:hypothetical protein [Pseudomonadota bacterium]